MWLLNHSAHVIPSIHVYTQRFSIFSTINAICDVACRYIFSSWRLRRRWFSSAVTLSFCNLLVYRLIPSWTECAVANHHQALWKCDLVDTSIVTSRRKNVNDPFLTVCLPAYHYLKLTVRWVSSSRFRSNSLCLCNHM